MKTSIGPRPILYPAPVLIIGTYDSKGRPNIMNAAWGGICCSDPPCVQVSVRKQRHTHAALLERQAFTVGIPDAAHAKEADYAGLYSGRDEDKFTATGLTPVRSKIVDAPYAEEFPVVLECRLAHTADLGAHTLFVGEILDVKADQRVLGADGMPDILKVDPMLFAPIQHTYYRVGEAIGSAFRLGRKP